MLGLVRGRAALARARRRAGRRRARGALPVSATAAAHADGRRRAAAQGAARRAAHVRVGAGDDAVQRHDLRALPLRPAGELARRRARERRAVGDAAVRGDARRSTACSSPTTSRAASTRFLLSPADRSALLLGKALVAARLPRRVRDRRRPGLRAAAARRRRSAQALPGLLALLALGDLGVAAIGTLVGALAVRTRARDLIGPLLSLPLLVPVVIGAARATTPLFSQPRRRRCRCAGC